MADVMLNDLEISDTVTIQFEFVLGSVLGVGFAVFSKNLNNVISPFNKSVHRLMIIEHNHFTRAIKLPWGSKFIHVQAIQSTLRHAVIRTQNMASG